MFAVDEKSQIQALARAQPILPMDLGQPERRTHNYVSNGTLDDMVLIADRPAEVPDRAVPGHWEGDLMLGVRGESAIATLVERQTRYVMLLAVGRDRTSARVCALIAKKIRTLPQHLAVSLTGTAGRRWPATDNLAWPPACRCTSATRRAPGNAARTRIPMVCSGSTYFPRGTDLSVHSQRHLNRVAHRLNDRPRQTLGWMKPSEKLAELLQ